MDHNLDQVWHLALSSTMVGIVNTVLLCWVLNTLFKGEKKIMVNIDDLTAQVTQNESVEESAVILIQGLASKLAAAGTDPVKLQALRDGLNKSASDLAAAITANTTPVGEDTPPVAPVDPTPGDPSEAAS